MYGVETGFASEHPRSEQSASMGYPLCDCVAAYHITFYPLIAEARRTFEAVRRSSMSFLEQIKKAQDNGGSLMVRGMAQQHAHLGIDGLQDRHVATATFLSYFTLRGFL